MQALNSILLTMGGLGLFLLGMVIMTDHLKSVAGDQLYAVLFRFTKTPTSGALTGAIATAILQSSSATTVAAVGFVSAGLMTFSNALGIIFGANIGTTITGWMVALLGFKFSIATFALPIIFIGVMLRLFSKHHWAHIGLAVAGFGLIFVGIATMQQAMVGMQEMIDFTSLPANTWFGRLQLLLLGLVFTMVTQSSSAGVALTLTALFAQIIQFEQAAALVIGMDVGTTITSLMATIGGTVGAKRTGLSHVIYNLLTAVFALLLITPYIQAWSWFSVSALQANAEIALVGFHTLFNLLGVLLILPFTHHFGRLIKKLLPEKTSEHTRRLEPQLLQIPEQALTAVQNTLLALTQALVRELHFLMGASGASQFSLANLKQLEQALYQTQTYLDAIHLTQAQSHLWKRLISMIHMLDHLQRLHERLEEESDRAEASKQFPILSKISSRLSQDIAFLQTQMQQQQWREAVQSTRQLHYFIRQDAEGYRQRMVQSMGQGALSADQTWDSLEAIRWMERVSKHLYRICYHQEKMLLNSGK